MHRITMPADATIFRARHVTQQVGDARNAALVMRMQLALLRLGDERELGTGPSVTTIARDDSEVIS